MKLVSKKIYKKSESYNVNPDFFIKGQKPIHAYLLGLLYADGNVSFHARSTRISCKITQQDGLEFLNLFLITGKWSSYLRPQTERGKACIDIRTNNRPLAEFLQNNDYLVKSSASPSKILSVIPKCLTHYFWRGFFDGDGCIFIKDHRTVCSFTGSFNQNWYDLGELLNLLDIKFTIEHRQYKAGSYSKIIFYGKKNAAKFYSYLYQGESFGLSRKRIKLSTWQHLLTIF